MHRADESTTDRWNRPPEVHQHFICGLRSVFTYPMSSETSDQVASEGAASGPRGQEGVDVRRRLYIFTAVLVLVFLVVVALGFLL